MLASLRFVAMIAAEVRVSNKKKTTIPGINDESAALAAAAIRLAQNERDTAAAQLKNGFQSIELQRQSIALLEENNRQLRAQLHEERLASAQREKMFTEQLGRAFEIAREEVKVARAQQQAAEEALIRQERALMLLQTDVDIEKTKRQAEERMEEIREKIASASSNDDLLRGNLYEAFDRVAQVLETFKTEAGHEKVMEVIASVESPIRVVLTVPTHLLPEGTEPKLKQLLRLFKLLKVDQSAE